MMQVFFFITNFHMGSCENSYTVEFNFETLTTMFWDANAHLIANMHKHSVLGVHVRNLLCVAQSNGWLLR